MHCICSSGSRIHLTLSPPPLASCQGVSPQCEGGADQRDSLCVCYAGNGNAGAIIGGIVVALLVAIIVVAVILVVLWIKRFLNYPLTTSLLHQSVCCYHELECAAIV